jgi:hypothetical protein
MYIKLTGAEVAKLTISGKDYRFDRGDTVDLPDLMWAAMSVDDKRPWTPQSSGTPTDPAVISQAVTTFVQANPDVIGNAVNVGMRKGTSAVQYRKNDTAPWVDVVPLADIKGQDGSPGSPGSPGAPGSPGDPGPAPEFRVFGGYIQVRPLGTSTWNNLVPLTDIKGPPGDGGTVTAQQLSDVIATGNVLVPLQNTSDGTTRLAMTPVERSKLGGVATGATANAADSALRDRSTHSGVQAISTVSGLQGALDAKPDLVGGVLPSSVLPSVSIVNRVPVANQAARLALTSSQVQPGDIAFQSDVSLHYLLTQAPASTNSNWAPVDAGGSAITSINGQTSGSVVLAAADVGAAPATVTPRYTGGKLYQPDGVTEIVVNSTQATPVNTFTTVPRTLAASDLQSLLIAANATDGDLLIPSGADLPLSQYPIGRSTKVKRTSTGTLRFIGAQGTLSTPSVRGHVDFVRDWDGSGGGINYTATLPTTAPGDVVLFAMARMDAFANWQMPTGWQKVTVAESPFSSGGPQFDVAAYLFVLPNVQSNLGGTTATFTAVGSDGRPAAGTMIAIQNAKSTDPIAAYDQTHKDAYDGSNAISLAAPSVGNYLDLAFGYSNNQAANYGEPADTALVSSTQAGSTGPYARLGVAVGDNLIAAGDTAPVRSFPGGDYGGSFRALINPVGSGPTISSPNGSRMLLPDTTVVITRLGLDLWSLEGGTEF